jgi:hypothetical protein
MNNDSLVCLVYASRRVGPDPQTLDDEVRDILIASIKNNRTVAVTGLLVAHKDWFLQALEGPVQAVMTTYHRIAGDPRHTDPALRFVRNAETRLFARWTMCGQTMSEADQTIIARLIEDQGFDPFTASEDAALTLLTTVADIHGKLLTQQHAELLGEVLWAA